MCHSENSIIINNIFSKETIVLGANFNNAIIDSLEFLAHLDKNEANNIPKEKIKDKQDLRLQLESRRLDQNLIARLLNLSKLPST